MPAHPPHDSGRTGRRAGPVGGGFSPADPRDEPGAKPASRRPRAAALALDAGIALIEFARFHEYDFHAVPAGGELESKPACYLAFTLPAGNPDAVTMIDLGEADPIDRMIADFRESVAAPPDYPEREDTRDMVSSNARQKTSLRWSGAASRCLRPMVPALGGHTRLLLSPDGQLARLPFAALPTDDSRFLADTHQISYVGSGRDVLRFRAENEAFAAEWQSFQLLRRGQEAVISQLMPGDEILKRLATSPKHPDHRARMETVEVVCHRCTDSTDSRLAQQEPRWPPRFGADSL